MVSLMIYAGLIQRVAEIFVADQELSVVTKEEKDVVVGLYNDAMVFLCGDLDLIYSADVDAVKARDVTMIGNDVPRAPHAFPIEIEAEHLARYAAERKDICDKERWFGTSGG